MADYLVTDTELTSVANAIRTKGGTSADLSFPTEFVSAIEAISSGGGLEYEEGTYTPSSDTIDPTIYFSQTHDSPPCIISMADASTTPYSGFGNYMIFVYLDSYKLFGGRFPNGSATGMGYGLAMCTYTAGGGGNTTARSFLMFHQAKHMMTVRIIQGTMQKILCSDLAEGKEAISFGEQGALING